MKVAQVFIALMITRKFTCVFFFWNKEKKKVGYTSFTKNNSDIHLQK